MGPRVRGDDTRRAAAVVQTSETRSELVWEGRISWVRHRDCARSHAP